MGLGHMDWIDLAQDRDGWQALVNVVINLQVPYNAENLLSTLGHVGFSGRTLLHGIQLQTSHLLYYLKCCQT
jgi:hypothetical protein